MPTAGPRLHLCWTQFLIARTASAAALAVGFAIFLNDLVWRNFKTAVLGPFTLPGGSLFH